MKIPIWGQPPMASSQPHEVITTEGRIIKQFLSKSAARRHLNLRIKHFDKRRQGPDDPRTWSVRAVRRD